MLRNTLAAALFVLPAVAFASPATADAAAQTDPKTARYVDITDWPASEAGLDRFAGAEAKLNTGFDAICGDTFCEGEYSNLRPLQLNCSVDSTKGTIKQCLWMFSGGSASVNPKSGAVQTSAKLYKCKLLLAKDTPVEAFYEVMDGEDPFNTKLPMSRYTAYDGLMGCL